MEKTSNQVILPSIPSPLCVSLVEDDRGTRDIVSQSLGRLEGVQCMASYGNAESVMKRIQNEMPHVLLVDLQLPRISGIELTRAFSKQYPELRIVILTKFDDIESIVEAMEAGAVGYLLKPVIEAKLALQLKQAYLGDSPLSPSVSNKMVDYFRNRAMRLDMIYGLSSREIQILKMLAKGQSDKLISAALGISISTVNFHTKNLYEKLDVNSRLEAVAKYFGQLS